ncbi:MAG: amidohydrolase family protein [Lawsonibacter sp.]|nr:amidohydrolase family protein [Lawsonibacter sp.]
MYKLIIKNGTLYDGTGAPGYVADIAVKDRKIAEIGQIDAPAEKIIDAAGKRVTPGFFDMHSHADLSIVQYPDAESLLGQGITTVFCGHCGMGMAPIGKWWKSQGDDVFALEDVTPLSSIGAFPGRTGMCRSDRMREAMESGAYGMSIGYDYTPDLSASHEELDRLVACVKEYDGIVAVHTRNGMDGNPEWQPGGRYPGIFGYGSSCRCPDAL